MEVNRDRKKSPIPIKIEEAAPWLAPLVAAKPADEAPDQQAIDALKSMALASRR